ncbi:MAG: M36 family metallopeptidase [Minicystis sp.]
MKRFGRISSPLVLALLATSAAHAQTRPSYDASLDRSATLAPMGARSLRAPHAPAKRPSLPVRVVSTDRARGVPSLVWAAQGSFVPALNAAAPRPADAARAHLGRLAGLYDLPPAALAAAVVREVHDTGRGGVIVTFGQEIDGVEVFHEKTKLLMKRGSLELVAASGHLHAAAVPRSKAAPRRFALVAEQAITGALDDLYRLGATPGTFVELPRGEGGYRRFDLAPGNKLRLSRPARVKKVYFPLPDRLVPAYYVEVFAQPAGAATDDVYAYVIAADDSRVLYRTSLKAYDTFQYRVWAETTGNGRPLDGPIEDYTPSPSGIPDGIYPSFIAPSLISMEGFNTNPDGKADVWLPPSAKETQGNNVDAYTDDDDPDGFSPGDIRASLTGPQAFDRVYDVTKEPIADDEQRMAAVTQLFYTTNWLHDYWYDSGFDEAAGNAQKLNYGRGGVAGDPLHAQAQDGALLGNLDNANMSTPADGDSPRMQMYLWSSPETRTLGVQPLNQNLDSGSAQFGPGDFDVSGTVVLVNDAAGTQTDACEPIANDVTGKIALIDRGMCSFQSKVQKAEAAGAKGVILVNNVDGGPPSMPGDQTADPTIPVLSVSLADGNAIKSALAAGPVTAQITRDVGVKVDGFDRQPRGRARVGPLPPPSSRRLRAQPVRRRERGLG